MSVLIPYRVPKCPYCKDKTNVWILINQEYDYWCIICDKEFNK
jgi:DNA-directed RNA polymerase subunit RPC12/RpoP